MHFAFIYSWDGMIPPSADNVKAYFVSKELVGRGQKVTWVRHSNRDARCITEEGIVIEEIGPLTFPKTHRLSFLLRVFSFCLRERVDLVYMDCWFLTRSGVHLLLLLQAMLKAIGTRVLYDARDPFPEYEIACGKLREGSLKTNLYRALSRLLYKRSDIVLITSNELREYLKVAYAIKPSKIHAIYHGADIEAFNLGKSEHGVRATLGLKDKFLVGWFGIMSRVRQVEQILLPLIKMTGQTIPNAVFIVGGKGPLRGSFESFISHYKCKNVLYLGYVPYSELGNYVAACDVTLCPLDISSFHGKYGLNRKVSESLSVGVPIIVTKTPAVQSFFGGFKSVKMVDNTPEAFMEAIVEVSKKSEYYKSVARTEAKSAVLSLQESSKKIADCLMDFFNEGYQNFER